MWDIFICHASEDKDDVARPIAEFLRNEGYAVWYDEFTLKLGDSIRKSIDYGIANSMYGLVIFSPHFFSKDWPQRELDGLLTKTDESGKIILPIWHNVDRGIIQKTVPTLAEKFAVSTKLGLDVVIKQILNVLRSGPSISQKSETNEPHLMRYDLGRVFRETKYPLNKSGITTIGKVNCDINIQDDDLVSEKHASLMLNVEGYSLQDENSATGVYFRIPKKQLMQVYTGNLVIVGSQFLLVSKDDEGYKFMHNDENGKMINCYPINEKVIIFGRVSPDITIDDFTISRRHMAVYAKNDELFVIDLDSANGTYIKFHGQIKIEHGSKFRIGRQLFELNLH